MSEVSRILEADRKSGTCRSARDHMLFWPKKKTWQKSLVRLRVFAKTSLYFYNHNTAYREYETRFHRLRWSQRVTVTKTIDKWHNSWKKSLKYLDTAGKFRVSFSARSWWRCCLNALKSHLFRKCLTEKYIAFLNALFVGVS